MKYNILYKTLIRAKPLRSLKLNGGTKHVVLLGPEKYDAVYNRIRYLISLKSGITDIFSHYYDNYDFSPIEKNWRYVIL